MSNLMFQAIRQSVGFVLFATQPDTRFPLSQSGVDYLFRLLRCTLDLSREEEPEFERLVRQIAAKLDQRSIRERSVLEPSCEEVLERGQRWQIKQGKIDGVANWSLTVREGCTLKFQAKSMDRRVGLLATLQLADAALAKSCDKQLQRILSQMGIYRDQFWCEDALYEQRVVFEPTLAGFTILDRDSVALLGPRLKSGMPEWAGGWQYTQAIITPLPGEELVVYERTGDLDIPRSHSCQRHPRRAFASVGGISLRLEPRGMFRGREALRIVAFPDSSLPIKADPVDIHDLDDDGDPADRHERADCGANWDFED